MLIEVLEAESWQLVEEPGFYVSSINNLLSFLVFRRRFEEAAALVAKAKVVYQRMSVSAEKRSLMKQMFRTLNIELEIYRITRPFAENRSFTAQTEAFVNQHAHKMPWEYLQSFWFQFANIHFMMKSYGESLKWLNLILNSRLREVRTDLQVQAHFLNLMVHLEQENFFVLRYFVDSTRRCLKKVKAVQPFEMLLLKFFAKIGRV